MNIADLYTRPVTYVLLYRVELDQLFEYNKQVFRLRGFSHDDSDYYLVSPYNSITRFQLMSKFTPIKAFDFKLYDDELVPFTPHLHDDDLPF